MVTAILVGESPVRLWSLGGRERIERQLAALPDVHRVTNYSALPASGTLLVLRADHVYEQRALRALLARRGLLLRAGRSVAAHVDATLGDRALRALEQGSDEDLPTFGVASLDSFEPDLRQSGPPLVAPVTPDNRGEIEHLLYGAAYKGITDFVTKWWWPRPARAAVRCCARYGITPNLVTFGGLLLMLATCWLFYHGQYAAGLLCGWIMTYLDTVDGKLARVTVRSSPLGHWLDHGMDILHPPFWYWLWGLSLVDFQPLAGIDRPDLYVAIFGAYVAGRVIEALFHLLGETSMFAWRPFDAYFRLFTARRNPCLVLLTLAWLVGSPALGLWLVAAWTVLSSVVMLARLLWGVRVRRRHGRLTSWLADAEACRRFPRAYAAFSGTRRAYG